MEKSITKIFIGCQASTGRHPDLINKLINIYLKNDFEKFFDYFIYLMKLNLIHGEKIPAIERTLTFIAKFATSVKSEEKEKEDDSQISEDDNADDIDPFLVAIYEFLLQNHDAVSKSVRYRVCQLINKILNCMGEQASIDDHLYNTIYDTMLQRLMDKCHSVRVQAILALSRLQDPRNKECPVIKAYLFHLSVDPNPEVRKAVLSNIAITFQTLPDILDRRRDMRDTVRRQAYIILSQKVHIRSFTIAQRIMIISEGLKDRSHLVRQALKKNVLQAWLRLVDGSILELLKCLDVEASKESAELALNSLFEDVPYDILLEKFEILDEKRLIPYDKLTAESALYWICLARHLRQEKADEHLEQILPDLTVFCNYIQEYIQKESPEEDPHETALHMMQKDFVCQQLISMTTFFDLADEVGRKSLCKLVRVLFIMPSVSETFIKTLSEVFTHLYPPTSRVNELVEIISDIRDPPEAEASINVTEVKQETVVGTPKEPKISEEDQRKVKLKLAQISVKMNLNREELEDCVRTLNLDKAMVLKEKLKELEEEKSKLLEEGASITPQATPVVVPCSQTRMPEDDDDEEVKLLNDPVTLSRCLLIFCEFLTSPDVTVFGSILRSLHDNLILPCLKSEYDGVRRLAVRGLNLCCLLSKELAKQYLLLLIQISKMDVVDIQSQALKGVFDIWMLYGLEAFNSAAEDVSEIEELIETEKAVDEDCESGGLEDDQTPAAKNMVPLLTKMLETESGDARTLTAEGLCKLLMASQITSTKLLSHLLILWYNPENEDDNMLVHMLGVFFPLYASLGGLNQEALGKALMPTLHTIFNAPIRSPLSEIDLDNMINFLVTVTSPSIASNASQLTVNAHDSMVFSLCAEILAHPDREYTRALVRSLNHLALTQTDYTRLKQVACLAQKIIEKVTDKVCLNSAQKFKHTIKSLLSSAPKEEDNQNETLSTTLVEPTAGDTTAESLPNSNQLRRKRILYTTQTDLELISDLDSENDRSPSKIKRLAQHTFGSNSTVNSDSFDLGVTNIGETDDEDLSKEIDEREITTTQEIELTTMEEPIRESIVQSSSDLFGSCDEGPQVPQKNSMTPNVSVISETEDDSMDSPSVNSSYSSLNESPPRKSPRMQGGQRLRRRSKKSIGSGKDNSKTSPKRILSQSSSSSFYSTRSTSETPEVTAPAGKRIDNSPEVEDTSPNDDTEGPLNRSLRVALNKLDISKAKPRISNRKTPRKTVEAVSTRSTRASKSSSVSTEDENQLRSRLSRVTVNETPTSSSTSPSIATRARRKNPQAEDEINNTPKDRKSTSPARKSRTKSSSYTVTETPVSSSSDSLRTITRSRKKAISQVLEGSQSRTTRSGSFSLRDSGSVTNSPAESSSASLASGRSRRTKK